MFINNRMIEYDYDINLTKNKKDTNNLTSKYEKYVNNVNKMILNINK